MRLATFQRGGAPACVGALIDADRGIVDLTAASADASADFAPSFRTMLDVIDAGDRALDIARNLVERVGSAGDCRFLVPRDLVALLAPVPVPPQMRDFLCFELHLISGSNNAVSPNGGGAARSRGCIGRVQKTRRHAAAVNLVQAANLLQMQSV